MQLLFILITKSLQQTLWLSVFHGFIKDNKVTAAVPGVRKMRTAPDYRYSQVLKGKKNLTYMAHILT